MASHCGLRDVLIHDYFGVDLAALWEITQKDLPKLKGSIEKILPETENDDPNLKSPIEQSFHFLLDAWPTLMRLTPSSLPMPIFL